MKSPLATWKKNLLQYAFHQDRFFQAIEEICDLETIKKINDRHWELNRLFYNEQDKKPGEPDWPEDE